MQVMPASTPCAWCALFLAIWDPSGPTRAGAYATTERRRKQVFWGTGVDAPREASHASVSGWARSRRGLASAAVTSEHERHNRTFWDDDADDYQAAHGAELAAAPLAWGAWRVPEAELR